MFRQRSFRNLTPRGFSLVEVLVVMVFVVAIAAGLMSFYAGKGHSKPGEAIHTPMSKANDTVCMSNLRSIRQAITAAQASDPDGKYPQSLDELREIGPDLRRCEVGHEPYQYDPTTGTVRCPHPGHENF